MKKKEKYGAFISYRQGNPDASFAKLLQRKLENYRTPGKLRKNGIPKQLGRVFRDMDELGASSNLSKEIKAALAEAPFLIVLCSPRAKLSRWINEEIRLFQEMGKGDKILTVLVEGTPDEAFPALITQSGEPLAADLRHDITLKPSRKKIPDVTLRLLAPLLGCDYDELRQRQHQRFVFLISAFSSVMMLIAIGFSILSWRLVSSNQNMEKAIYENAAVYAQFFLVINDDYEKWSKVTSKVLEILNEKDVERAIKLNSIVAKYIALKGYEQKNKEDVYPFMENPEYFLKSIFYRKSKFTVGMMDWRFYSFFMLSDLQFPADLLHFFADPPVEPPDTYQRIQTASRQEMMRFSNVLRAIILQSSGRQKEAIELLRKSDALSVLHRLAMGGFGFDLARIIGEIDGYQKKRFLEMGDNERMPTKKEEGNLVKNLNAFYLLVMAYARSEHSNIQLTSYQTHSPVSQSDIKMMLLNDDLPSSWGTPRIYDILTWVVKKLKPLNLPSSDPLEQFVAKLHQEIISVEKEWQQKQGHKKKKILEQVAKGLAEIRNNLNKELSKILPNTPGNSLPSIDNATVDDLYPVANKMLSRLDSSWTSFPVSADVFDDNFDKLAPTQRQRLAKIIGVEFPQDVKSWDARAYIAQKIRPYRLHQSFYDYFLLTPFVQEKLQENYIVKPKDPTLALALARLSHIKGNCFKAQEYGKTSAVKFSQKDISYYVPQGECQESANKIVKLSR
ncbi:MAG: toll/interleukin-1 receptor domain-containing protein [Magnetococcales bacterium]|nr:toll/interleukin-1 receptor domain-containing protein [Magnetococcales bacterium]